MSQPNANTTELDGALGVLPPSEGKLYAVVGVSSSGAVDTPATYAREKDVITAFGAGPLVEAACHYIQRYGRPVVIVRTGQSVLGAYLDAVAGAPGAISAITKTGTGTAVFTNNASAPLVDADVKVLFNVGGTQGVAGIVYQISLDGGNTWGPPQALGTDADFAIGATGASIAVSAGGTIVAGDFIEFTLTAPIPASAGEVTVDFAGTSVPTIDAATHPNDDYEVFLKFVAGGTRGITGITYQWSLDGGRTMSPVTALGVATSIVIPGSGGVKVDLSAGTIVAGDSLAFPTVAPRWNNAEIATALTALRASAVSWEIGHVVGPIDPDAFDAIDLAFVGMAAAGKNRAWIGNTRMPIGDETEATYLASLTAAFSLKATVYGALCAGAIKLTSGVSGRKYRRPWAFAAAAREAFLSEEQNAAAIVLGPYVGVSIRDANGNPDEHDESVNPGLDDARFYVARTWESRAGVYANRPRIFSAEGSDFQLVPHRRVMNIARSVIRAYLEERCNLEIRVNKATGFILEEEALEIEATANALLAAALLSKPKASAARYVLNRNDNVLSTKTLNGQARIVPLAYPEFINTEVGFENPALQTTAV